MVLRETAYQGHNLLQLRINPEDFFNVPFFFMAVYVSKQDNNNDHDKEVMNISFKARSPLPLTLFNPP